MDSMIDRIRAALLRSTDGYGDMTLAAIDAMQEPTEAMLEAADRAMVGMLTETKAQRMACLRAGYAAAMKAAK